MLASRARAPDRRDRRWPERHGGDRRASRLQHMWPGPGPASRVRRTPMRCHNQRWVPVLMTLSLLFLVVMPVWAADPDIDRLLRSPVGKDWVTNGGNLTNQRYSTLKQIDTSNVKDLKGAWMIRLKGSAYGGKYSHEATPLVKDGVMYVITGNDDAFAVNAKTGEFLWEYWSGIDQKINTVC